MRLNSVVGTKIDTKYTAVKLANGTKQVEPNILLVFSMGTRLVSFHLDFTGSVTEGRSWTLNSFSRSFSSSFSA